MDLNSKTTENHSTELVTATSLIKSSNLLQLFMNQLTDNFSFLFQQIKGAIMPTVNGKLVHFDPNHFGNDLKPMYQLEEFEQDKRETLQTSLDSLEMRVNFLETNTVMPLKNQLQAMEKRTSKQILALSIMGAIGFTSLGLWVGLNNPSVSLENSANLSKADEIHQR